MHTMTTSKERHIHHNHADMTDENKPLLPHSIPSISSSISSISLARILHSVLFGFINTILTVPCMYGYAAIIFHPQVFASHLPQLCKLVLFSSVVHQLTFTFFSSLPFAIGQVQDAGLIFLAAMTGAIVQQLHYAHADDQTIIATTLVTLAISTALLGVTLYIVGRYQLASIVSYIPMPVIGGYLAFIGWFCLTAGLSLCANVSLITVSDWLKLLTDSHNMILIAPGILSGLVFVLVSHHTTNFFILPIVMLSIPVLFYTALFISGTTLAEARQYGWMNEVSDEPSLFAVFALYSPTSVVWSVMPSQFVTWFAMTIVVAFSSCLDVAAIEMDIGSQLDISSELSMVGISNLFSGITGGYTGSYIFSQTILTRRAKVNSRISGAIVAICELILFLIPYSLLSYIPSFFFAAMLFFIAFDLLYEWLILIFPRLLIREYIILLFTFLCICCTSIEMGMLVGIVSAAFNFLSAYSLIPQVVRTITSQSNVVRNVDSRSWLEQHRNHIVTMELSGFLFFGSAIRIMRQVQRNVRVRVWIAADDSDEESNAHDSQATRRYESTGRHASVLPRTVSGHFQLRHLDGHPIEESASSHAPSNQLETKFIVFDFSHVIGLDATAVRSCFYILKQLCARHGIVVVFTSLQPSIESIFAANGVLTPITEASPSPTCLVLPDIASGSDYCETQLIKMMLGSAGPFHGEHHHHHNDNHHHSSHTSSSVSSPIHTSVTVRQCTGGKHHILTGGNVHLSDILADFLHLGTEHQHHQTHSSSSTTIQSLSSSSADINLSELEEYFIMETFEENDILFDIGNDSDRLYVLLKGEISLYSYNNNSYEQQQQEVGDINNNNNNNSSVLMTSTKQYISPFSPPNYLIPTLRPHHSLLLRMRSGTLFGDVGFMLQTVRHLSAQCTSQEAIVHCLTRQRWNDMQAEKPALFTLFQLIVTKNMSLAVNRY